MLGIVVLLWPNLPSHNIRWVIGALLVLGPVILPALTWLWQAGRVLYRRAYWYPALRQRARWEIDQLDELKTNLVNILHDISGVHLCEIARATCYEGKLYIVLNKRSSPKLAKGDALVGVHRTDARLMGFFEVTEVRHREYYAVGTSNIDPLWRGHIQDLGEAQITPNIYAAYLPQGEAK